ncbi:hypothetical protein ACLB2K_002511 [Fragaria x ananassa]
MGCATENFFLAMISPIYHSKVQENHFTKNERDLKIILQYYDVEKRKFFFGDKEMEVMGEDREDIWAAKFRRSDKQCGKKYEQG